MQGGGGVPQPGQAGLWDTGGDECGEDQSGGAPHQRPREAGARGGETSSTSTWGSIRSAISRWATTCALAKRGSFAGGSFSPTKLYRRLKASSTRHRKRYRAPTSWLEKQSADNEVTRITQPAAYSVSGVI